MESHLVLTTKSTLFMVSKDEWITNEGTGKSMKTGRQEAVENSVKYIYF